MASSSIPSQMFRTISLKPIRSLHTSTIVRAATAAAPSSSPAPAPVKRIYTPRKVIAPAKSKLASPQYSPLPASSAPTSATTASPTASALAPAPAAEYDPYDFDDLPAPSSEIEDYAALKPSPSSPRSGPSSYGTGPTPSPPLTSLPGPSYTPLPSSSFPLTSTASGATGASVQLSSNSNGIAGEVLSPAIFHGLSEKPFEKDIAEALLKPLDPDDVEVKPDGLLYLPEIKYRRTLNAAFGPGGWGLAPRGETNVGDKIVSREWGLVCLGRLVSIARGEQEYFDKSGIPTATEACKSNALMRCCKDLGIASELWDPSYIRQFKQKHCVEVFVEHATKKSKRKLWRKKNAPKFDYPYKEI